MVVSITGADDDSRTRSIVSEHSFLFLYPSPRDGDCYPVFGAKPPPVFSTLIFEYRVDHT